MLFNSFAFLVFFPVVTLLYFLLPHKLRWMLLLIASCFFYMFFKPEYILILAATIVIDYIAGILLEDQPDKKKRKKFLVLSIIANVGVLAIFKYYNFINTNVTGLALLFGMKNPIPYLNWLLPIGLSFHTFQAMSYTIEVYRGHQKAERHFGIYALYVMFYPQLVAGPIERPQNMIHQFYAKHTFDYNNAVWGLNMIAWGLFKKIVVADRLAEYVNFTYANIGVANTTSALLACCFFSIQIYCDFSGYSDIARGTAKFMGFDLMVNFNRPYIATSLSEFWTRWHISLSTWFKDYVYIPLGGNRAGKWRWYRNLLIIFLLSGLWHGANWTFIIWGALHGSYIIFGLLTMDARNKLAKNIGLLRAPVIYKAINQCIVFAMVTFAWIFFRAENFAKAKAVISKLLVCNFSFKINQVTSGMGPLNLLLSFMVIGILWLSTLLPANLKMKHNLLFLTITTFLIIILGKNAGATFIYFQF
ncbi:MAG: poly(beta-D-mannuronate) O-acetylase [Flavipsychrobacter sp.]|nr:poly(beta-D-mannuronate) O-acetylase [Flavipsychrobacter sp.]